MELQALPGGRCLNKLGTSPFTPVTPFVNAGTTGDQVKSFVRALFHADGQCGLITGVMYKSHCELVPQHAAEDLQYQKVEYDHPQEKPA